MFRLFLYIGDDPYVSTIAPHSVLCDVSVQKLSLIREPHDGSLRVMDPIPYFVIASTGTFTETRLCFSSQISVITFFIVSATT